MRPGGSGRAGMNAVPLITRRLTLLGLSGLLGATICALVIVVAIELGSNAKRQQAMQAPVALESDRDIEFPEVLSDLPFAPGKLAIDPQSGDLSFAGPTDGQERELFHFSAGDRTLRTRTIPASSNYLFWSAAIDSRGHLIAAEGSAVLDVDPTGGYVEHQLPPNGYITDMVLTDDGQAYVSKAYLTSIIKLDLQSGEIREFSLPDSMLLVHHIALVGDRLWMAAPVSAENIPAQIAVLDLETGVAEEVPMRLQR